MIGSSCCSSEARLRACGPRAPLSEALPTTRWPVELPAVTRRGSSGTGAGTSIVSHGAGVHATWLDERDA